MVKTKKKFLMPSGIKNKMVAAIAMLLVSTILMVNSTYAWFTLSTAPEVTGITTSVGANGSLEIALLPSNGDIKGITTNVGDSMKALLDKNITWGNLIDLSDGKYGLDMIKLMPSRLNLDYSTRVVATSSILSVPVYGADGRVAELANKTQTATLIDDMWKIKYDATSLVPAYGVRAIGVDNKMSVQAVGLAQAKQDFASKLAVAKTTMRNALDGNSELANALVAAATGSAASLTQTQKDAISALRTAAVSALDSIKAAYKAAWVAEASKTIANEADYRTKVEAINAAALTASVEGLTNATLSAAITKVNNITITELTDDDASYKTVLGELVNTNTIVVNGLAKNSLMGADGKPTADFMTALQDAGFQVIVTIPYSSSVDGGILGYIGSVAGNYSAKVSGIKSPIDTITITLSGNMVVSAEYDAATPASVNSGSAIGTTGADVILSDTYGYALDFAFRTNAASSYLKLQTQGIGRVYGEDGGAATQGEGSYFSFKVAPGATFATAVYPADATPEQKAELDAAAAKATDEKVEALMKAIRVAFIDPTSGALFGIAAVDMDSQMHPEDPDAARPAGQDKQITKDAAGNYKGYLELKDLDLTHSDGVLRLTDKAAPASGTEDTTAKLFDMTQNAVHKLTAIVYLDGDYVDNGDVANAMSSLVGTLNLQFASSAELIPMEDTALKNMGNDVSTTAATEATTAAVGGAG